MTEAGTGHGFSDNGKLLIDMNAAGATVNVLVKDQTVDDTVVHLQPICLLILVFVEDADNTGTFSNVDDSDAANLNVQYIRLKRNNSNFQL